MEHIQSAYKSNEKLLESVGVQQNVYKFYEECFANTEEVNSDDDISEYHPFPSRAIFAQHGKNNCAKTKNYNTGEDHESTIAISGAHSSTSDSVTTLSNGFADFHQWKWPLLLVSRYRNGLL